MVYYIQDERHVMGMKKKYSKELKIKVANEAALPEKKRCEHIIAEKYDIMPWTARKWSALYWSTERAPFLRE